MRNVDKFRGKKETSFGVGFPFLKIFYAPGMGKRSKSELVFVFVSFAHLKDAFHAKWSWKKVSPSTSDVFSSCFPLQNEAVHGGMQRRTGGTEVFGLHHGRRTYSALKVFSSRSFLPSFNCSFLFFLPVYGLREWQLQLLEFEKRTWSCFFSSKFSFSSTISWRVWWRLPRRPSYWLFFKSKARRTLSWCGYDSSPCCSCEKNRNSTRISSRTTPVSWTFAARKSSPCTRKATISMYVWHIFCRQIDHNDIGWMYTAFFTLNGEIFHFQILFWSKFGAFFGPTLVLFSFLSPTSRQFLLFFVSFPDHCHCVSSQAEDPSGVHGPWGQSGIQLW